MGGRQWEEVAGGEASRAVPTARPTATHFPSLGLITKMGRLAPKTAKCPASLHTPRFCVGARHSGRTDGLGVQGEPGPTLRGSPAASVSLVGTITITIKKQKPKRCTVTQGPPLGKKLSSLASGGSSKPPPGGQAFGSMLQSKRRMRANSGARTVGREQVKAYHQRQSEGRGTLTFSLKEEGRQLLPSEASQGCHGQEAPDRLPSVGRKTKSAQGRA